MKLIRVMDTLTVVLNNGDIISTDNCSDEMFRDIFDNQDDEEIVKGILLPEFFEKKELAELKQGLFDGLDGSNHLVAKGSSVYLPNISELSVPEDLVTAILKAEKNNNGELLQTYLNFWTLVSLNPDSRCRQNLFWFLERYGMTISKSGLFVAYRNADVKKSGAHIDPKLANFISSEYARIKFVSKKSPKDFVVKMLSDGTLQVEKKNAAFHTADTKTLADLYQQLSDIEISTVYTDQHSRTFEIKIGEIVSMPRESCDKVQENTCSRGLHVAGKDWLQQNYFGSVGLMVLVNPADVVAVPPQDNYGKMRTAAYYPVSVVEWDENGKIIDFGIEDGFEDDFIDKICYSGMKNADDINPYQVVIPDIPEIDKSMINNRLLEIAPSLNKTVR